MVGVPSLPCVASTLSLGVATEQRDGNDSKPPIR